MRVNTSDGLPVSYSQGFASSDKRGCATQSTAVGGSEKASAVGQLFTPSPRMSLIETSSYHPHSQPPQPYTTPSTFGAPSAALQTYPHPDPQASLARDVWPTPPAEDYEDYSLKNSPMSSNSVLQGARNDSPQRWSSQEDQRLKLPMAPWRSPNHFIPCSDSFDPSMSHDGLFQPQLTSSASSSFIGEVFSTSGLDNADGFMAEVPPMMPDVPGEPFAFTPPSESPQIKQELVRAHAHNREPAARLQPSALGRGAVSRTDSEPYAKLIYRALMNTPEKTMSLQDLYQWFRDNTIRGKASSKGWQNSVRHNLSMNKAFIRDGEDEEGNIIGVPKKNSIWHVSEKAIREGVQSTTRFRKKPSGGRGHGSTQQTKRANTRRKRGVSNRSKAASTKNLPAGRGALRQGQRMSSSASLAVRAGIPNDYHYAFGYPSYHSSPSSGVQEPVTPPDFHAGDVMYPAASGFSSAHSNQGYPYPNGTLQHHPGPSHSHGHGFMQQPNHHPQQLTQEELHQLPPHPQHQHNTSRIVPIYAIGNIDGVYRESLTPVLPGSRSQDRTSGATAIPAAYSSVFASPEDFENGGDTKGSFIDWVDVGAASGPGSSVGSGSAYH